MKPNLIDACDIHEIDKILQDVDFPKNIKNYLERLRDTVVIQQQQLKEIRKVIQKIPHEASEIVRLTHGSQTAIGNILVFLQNKPTEIDHILGLDKEF